MDLTWLGSDCAGKCPKMAVSFSWRFAQNSWLNKKLFRKLACSVPGIQTELGAGWRKLRFFSTFSKARNIFLAFSVRTRRNFVRDVPLCINASNRLIRNTSAGQLSRIRFFVFWMKRDPESNHSNEVESYRVRLFCRVFIFQHFSGFNYRKLAPGRKGKEFFSFS